MRVSPWFDRLNEECMRAPGVASEATNAHCAVMVAATWLGDCWAPE